MRGGLSSGQRQQKPGRPSPRATAKKAEAEAAAAAAAAAAMKRQGRPTAPERSGLVSEATRARVAVRVAWLSANKEQVAFEAEERTRRKDAKRSAARKVVAEKARLAKVHRRKQIMESLHRISTSGKILGLSHHARCA